MKAMSLKSEDRYSDVKELQAEIQAHESGFATSAEDASAAKLLMLFVKRHRGLAAAAALIVALIIAALFQVKASEQQAIAAAEEADAERARAETARQEAEQATLEQLRISQTAAPEFVDKVAALLTDGKLDAAADAADTAIALAPELSDAWHQHGRVHLANKRFHKAEESFERAAMLSPHDTGHMTFRRISAHYKFLENRAGLENNQYLDFARELEELGDHALAAHMYREMGDATQALKIRILRAFEELEELNPEIEFKRDTKWETGYHYYYWHHQIKDDGLTFTLPSFNGGSENLVNISPLRGLPMKSFKSLPYTGVTDLTPLSGMPLEYLLLNNTGIVGLNALKGMPLKHLNIGNTKVSDLSPLAGMKLTSFHNENTKVNDFSPLAGLPLEDLTITNNRDLRDLSVLKGAPLKRVMLDNLNLPDLDFLLESPVEELIVRSNAQAIDFGAIRAMPLKMLSVSMQQAFDPSLLAGKEMDYLYLAYTQIPDLDAFDTFSLKRLRIAHTGVKNFDAFKKQDLTELRVDERDLVDISALEGKQLSKVFLWAPKVTDLSVLADMPVTEFETRDMNVAALDFLKGKRLERFITHNNAEISDISFLADMPIYEVDLGGCTKLTDLTPLKNCPNLKSIGLPPNHGDISWVKDLPRKPKLRPGDNSTNGHYLYQDAYWAHVARQAAEAEAEEAAE